MDSQTPTDRRGFCGTVYSRFDLGCFTGACHPLGDPRVVMRESSNLVGSDIPLLNFHKRSSTFFCMYFFGVSPNSFKVFCQAFLNITDHIQHLHLHLKIYSKVTLVCDSSCQKSYRISPKKC